MADPKSKGMDDSGQKRKESEQGQGKKEQEKKGRGWAGTPEIRFINRLFETKAIYGFIAVVFILFLITRSTVFSALTILGVLFLLIGESLIGVSEHGARKELFEIVVAVVTALVIWFGAGFLLSTPAPLNAIVSCSMLPNLERGDLVILQGTEPKGVDVYVDNFDYTDISVKVEGQGEYSTNLSLAQYCAYDGSYPLCKTYWTAPEKLVERYGQLEFRHGWCTINSKDQTGEVPCVKSITVGGKEYAYGDLAGDTIVYSTLPTDEFSKPSGTSKEIIHRVFMKVHSNGMVYYLTKGDNNQFFDLQYGNSPPAQKRTVGKVILRIPYLGYFKLFLFGFLSDPAGCDRVFVKR